MSLNLRNKKTLISLISKIKNPKLRKAVMNDFIEDDLVYKALQEVAINTVNGRVPLTSAQKQKIREKKAIHLLAKPTKKNKRVRKKVVSQLGNGFWSILIPVVLSLLASKN